MLILHERSGRRSVSDLCPSVTELIVQISFFSLRSKLSKSYFRYGSEKAVIATFKDFLTFYFFWGGGEPELFKKMILM